jgi:equilibrative nucleoside transporter 1/2/3
VAKRNFTTTNGLLYLIMFVFATTFTVFPAFTFDSELKMLSGLPNSDGWFVLLMNTLFSIFDSAGRKMGGLPQFDVHTGTLKIFSACRLIFIVTFYLVAFRVGPSWLFVSDWFILLNMICFAFTNGYCSTLCAVKAPMQVSDEHKGQVGSFVGTCLTGGIFLGSLIALAETPLYDMTQK